MKTTFSALAVSALLFSTALLQSSTVLPVENNATTVEKAAGPSFSYFRTHRQGKSAITATWGLTSTEGVTGFRVEMTYGEPSDPYAFWEALSMMANTGSRSYKTTTEVFPGYITCRVVAIMSSGDEMVSELSTIRLVSH